MIISKTCLIYIQSAQWLKSISEIEGNLLGWNGKIYCILLLILAPGTSPCFPGSILWLPFHSTFLFLQG